MKTDTPYRLNHIGFTLVELLIAMAISAILMTGIISVYLIQQKTYVVETQVAAMQQNIRAGLYPIVRELRMTGCDPTGVAGAGIQTADTASVQFTSDITGGESDGKDNDKDGSLDEADENMFSDGDTNDNNENITLSIADSDGDGDTDLLRNNEPIAENIDALNFVYLDENGNVLATPVSDPSDIRSIQVTVVAKTGQLDPNYTNSTDYTNQQGTVILAAQNDAFRRRVLSTNIKLRNIGL